MFLRKSNLKPLYFLLYLGIEMEMAQVDEILLHGRQVFVYST